MISLTDYGLYKLITLVCINLEKAKRLRHITGTVARDHLASERTWLTYVQTSLAIASIGVGGFRV